MASEAGDAQAALGWALAYKVSGEVLVGEVWVTRADAQARREPHDTVCAVVPAAEYDRLVAAEKALARVREAITLAQSFSLTSVTIADLTEALVVPDVGAGQEKPDA